MNANDECMHVWDTMAMQANVSILLFLSYCFNVGFLVQSQSPERVFCLVHLFCVFVAVCRASLLSCIPVLLALYSFTHTRERERAQQQQQHILSPFGTNKKGGGVEYTRSPTNVRNRCVESIIIFLSFFSFSPRHEISCSYFSSILYPAFFILFFLALEAR